MLTAFLLTLKIASLLTSTGHDASDSHLFAMACTRNATELVSAERLCAVAFVESKMHHDAVNASGHCGAWQQHPRWTADFSDDGAQMDCGELTDVTYAARVAARYLTRLEARHHARPPLCRYAGATGERCRAYTLAVTRVESRLTP